MNKPNIDKCTCVDLLLFSKDYWLDSKGLFRCEPYAIIDDTNNVGKKRFMEVAAVVIEVAEKKGKPIRYPFPSSLFSIEYVKERNQEAQCGYKETTILYFNVEKYNRLGRKEEGKQTYDAKRILTHALSRNISVYILLKRQDYTGEWVSAKLDYQQDQDKRSIGPEDQDKPGVGRRRGRRSSLKTTAN